jgi:hypothetical protein
MGFLTNFLVRGFSRAIKITFQSLKDLEELLEFLLKYFSIVCILLADSSSIGVPSEHVLRTMEGLI